MLFFGDIEGDWWTTKHGSFDNNLLFIPVLLPLVWSWLLNSSRCLVLLGPAKLSSVLKVLSTSWVLVDWRLVDFDSFQYWICHRLLFLIILSCVALGNQCHNWLFKILLCDVFPQNIYPAAHMEMITHPVMSDPDICSIGILCCTCFQKHLIKNPRTEVCRGWRSVKISKVCDESCQSDYMHAQVTDS